VAYALSGGMKIIDIGWPSRSVITSMVGPTLATAGILVGLLLDHSMVRKRAAVIPVL